MKPDRWQQAVAALSVLLVVAATIAAGFLLALGEGGLRLGAVEPTATAFVIPTIGEPLPTSVRPDEEEVITATIDVTEAVEESPTPEATRTLPATPTQHDMDPPCQVRVGWTAYTVQAGETLAAISQQYGLTANAVQRGSCLNGQALRPGDVIYVPAATPTLTPPASDDNLQPTGTQTTTDGACTNPDSLIALPEVGAILSGSVEFYGTARLPDFSYYKLEIRPERSTAQDYVTFHTSEVQVSSSVLHTLDTRAFNNGSYWVRLVVVNMTGNYPERCAILYTIQN